MNDQLTNIKEFIQENLESYYLETAEELMIINPICGVIQKLINNHYDKFDELKEENNKLRLQIEEQEKRAIELGKKEAEINRIIRVRDIPYRNSDNIMGKLLDIKNVIGKYFNTDIDKKTRRREVVYARQMGMYYARKLTPASLDAIGAIMGNKDHATVLYAVHTIEDLRYYERTKINIKDLDNIFKINWRGSISE